MRQNIQNRSKELSCPKGFPKAGRQLIRKSWAATGMLNDLVASKSLQVHKLRSEKRKGSPDSRVDRYGSTSACWRYLPLPRPYVSRWPNQLGKEENHGRGKPGAPNKTPETRPKQGPSATCSLEPRGFLNEAKANIDMSHTSEEPFHPSNLAGRGAISVDRERLGELPPNVGSQLS